MGAAPATAAGMGVTEMPAGAMTATGSTAIGAMPGGPIMGASTATTAGMAVTKMPPGGMTAVGSMVTGEMPSGPMMAAASTAKMAGLGMDKAAMPSGDMTSPQRYAANQKSELPTMEISGEWRLTLSPASFRSGTGN